MAKPTAVQELGKASTDKRVDECSHLVLKIGELFVARVASTARKVVRVPAPDMEDALLSTASAGERRSAANEAA
jgi:hypothetical protein